MKFDYSKLKGLIIEKFGNQCRFAKELRVSEHTLSKRLNNFVEFRQSDIVKICDVLGIDPADIHTYFFTVEV